MYTLFKRINGFVTIIKLCIFHPNRISAYPVCTLLSQNSKITVYKSGSLRTRWILLGVNSYLQAEGRLDIGNGTYFNRNCTVVCKQQISIGENCSIGPNVCIYDHDHAFGENGQISGEFKCADIVIGNNVWVGAGAIILRGTHIGDNCVIGAGSIISGNVSPNTLVTSSRELNYRSLIHTI